MRKDRQEANIHRDVGVSGGTGTNSRAGWRDLNARLVSGDMAAIDRTGRRWMDTVNAVRDLRAREVRIRSLAQTEATWVTYLASEPDTAEAVIGNILTTFMAWAAEQELQAVSRRTRAGLERARAEMTGRRHRPSGCGRWPPTIAYSSSGTSRRAETSTATGPCGDRRDG